MGYGLFLNGSMTKFLKKLIFLVWQSSFAKNGQLDVMEVTRFQPLRCFCVANDSD